MRKILLAGALVAGLSLFDVSPARAGFYFSVGHPGFVVAGGLPCHGYAHYGPRLFAPYGFGHGRHYRHPHGRYGHGYRHGYDHGRGHGRHYDHGRGRHGWR